MEKFFYAHQSELLWTVIVAIAILIIRYAANKAIKRIGDISNFVEARTLLITKYVSILLLLMAVGALIFIWGVNFKDLGLLFSSVFAVIGVALFAQWSILSNITSGVILFFTFPFKIGNRIRILDGEINDDENAEHNLFVIEDIKAFHVHLRRSNGELLTYPNNMMLQKAVALVDTPLKSSDKIESL